MKRLKENQFASSLQLSEEVESQTWATISSYTLLRCTLHREGLDSVHITASLTAPAKVNLARIFPGPMLTKMKTTGAVSDVADINVSGTNGVLL